MDNRLSVVILNYCDSERAIKCANTVSRFSVINNVVIVDNNSSENEKEKLKHSIRDDKISLVFSDKNDGFASGNNIGARYVINTFLTEYLMFINPDIEVSEACVNECLSIIEGDEKIGCIGPRCFKPDGQEEISAWSFPSYKQYLKYCLYGYRRRSLNVPYLSTQERYISVDTIRGSFMLFRTEYFVNVNMFDERTFLYNEENIICLKLKKNNRSVVRANKVYCVHNHKNTNGSKLFSIKSSMDSNYYYLTEYKSINALKRLLLKAFMKYGTFEERLIEIVKTIKGY